MVFTLTTTKRKFNKILDSISNASSPSLAPQNNHNNASTTTLPTANEPAVKKPRLARPTSSSIKDAAAARNTGNRPSLRQMSPSSTNKERRAPNFAPWDRGQFLDRLATFRHVDRWTGKPEIINEVQWAKRGWTCVGKERVGCVGGCGREVVIKLGTDPMEYEEDLDSEQIRIQDGEASPEGPSEDWRDNAREQLVEKYAEMIITEHFGGCLWRRRGCDDTIYRLPLAHQNTALDSLRLRYESLSSMASELPTNLCTPTSYETNKFSRAILRILQPSPATPSPDAPPPYAEPQPLNMEALTLAIFGWQAEANHVVGLATCTTCFRRLGLWLFKSPSTSSDDYPPEPAAMARLDVIGEHRDYCPWINSISQNGSAAPQRPVSLTKGLAGWETLLRLLVNTQDSMRGNDNPPRPQTDGAASEVASIASSDAIPESSRSKEDMEKERWAKLKRLKRVFNIRKRKGNLTSGTLPPPKARPVD